jgi:hypothetical protein
METSVALFTVKVTGELVIPLSVAVMSVVPVVTEVARPFEPAVLEIAATPGLVEVQVTDVVRVWLVLSVYVPVATNCSELPRAIEGAPGVTLNDFKVAVVTVSVTPGLVIVVLPTTADAVITDVPVDTEVARPTWPVWLEMVATATVAELHDTWVVIGCVVPSLNVPVAVNCAVVPRAIEALGWSMAIEVKTAAVMVNNTFGLWTSVPPVGVIDALMFAVPAARPFACPNGVALETEAMVAASVAQVTTEVRSPVVPLE